MDQHIGITLEAGSSPVLLNQNLHFLKEPQVLCLELKFENYLSQVF